MRTQSTSQILFGVQAQVREYHSEGFQGRASRDAALDETLQLDRDCRNDIYDESKSGFPAG